MKQYLEQHMYYDAYKVACLGVSQNDWQTLALEALEVVEFFNFYLYTINVGNEL